MRCGSMAVTQSRSAGRIESGLRPRRRRACQATAQVAGQGSAATGCRISRGHPSRTVRFTESHVARDVCFCCKTAVGVGPSGRVDVVWRHIFPESMRDIAMASSTDGGRTFSPLARVSEDNWQLSGCPDDGPAMAIDARGSAHIAWPTLVNDDGTTKGDFLHRRPRTAARSTGEPGCRASIRRTPLIRKSPSMTAGHVAVVWDEQQGKTRRIVMRVAADGQRTVRGAARAERRSAPSFIRTSSAATAGFLVAWGCGPATIRSSLFSACRTT